MLRKETADNAKKAKKEGKTGQKKLITGIVPTFAASICPDLEWLQGEGFAYKEEINYIFKDDNGDKSTNIAVYLKNKKMEFISPVYFRIKHGYFLSRTGKMQFINSYGATKWIEVINIENSEDIDIKAMQEAAEAACDEWFLNDGVTPSRRGLEDLFSFLYVMSYVNKGKDRDPLVGAKDVQKLIESIEKGNFAPLQKWCTSSKGNVIKALIGIREKDGYYNQVVYDKMFGYDYTTKRYFDAFVNKEDKEGKKFNLFSTENYPVEYSYDIKGVDIDDMVEEPASEAKEERPEGNLTTSSSEDGDPFSAFADDLPF